MCNGEVEEKVKPQGPLTVKKGGTGNSTVERNWQIRGGPGEVLAQGAAKTHVWVHSPVVAGVFLKLCGLSYH